METPPTYMPPRPKNKTAMIVWIVIGVFFGCCILPIGLVTGLGFWGFSKVKSFAGCMFAYQDVQRGVLKYAGEHGGKLPKAETWQDDVRESYRASMRPKREMGPFEEMAPDGDWGCKDSNGVMSGMAFNSDLSGKKLDDIKDQVSTIMLFETEHPAKNQHEKYQPRDFANSPLMFGSHRGWMEVAVSGPPWMTDKSGRHVPLNTGPGAGGGGSPFDVQVKPNPGPDDK